MFSADVHRVTKVSNILVQPLGAGYGESGYVTISLKISEGTDSVKFTFFSDNLDEIWEQFGNAMLKADAVYEDNHGVKA